MIMGALVVGGFFIRTRVRFMKKLNLTMPNEEMRTEYDRICEEMMLREAPELWVCDVPSPALMGRKILLPAGISGQTLRYALLHELTHFQRKDHIMVVLMSALRCVYWFNPLVWIAFRAMQEDMEVACDAGVMERIGTAEKKAYLTTLLNLFSMHSVPAIGMAQAESKRAAKARIEGAFRKHRTGRAMRIVSAVIACMILICCFTTACQPTPEKPIVINKNDGKLEEKIAGEAVVFEEEKTEDKAPDESQLYYLQNGQSALAKAIGAPEHWNVAEESYKIPFGTLNLTVDAEVHIPDAKAEVDTVNLQIFTAEEKQGIIDLFFGGKEVYIEDTRDTKAEIMEELVDTQKVVAEVEKKFAEGIGGYSEEDVTMERNTLAYLQELWEKAPEERQDVLYADQELQNGEPLELCVYDSKGRVSERLEFLVCDEPTNNYARTSYIHYSTTENKSDWWIESDNYDFVSSAPQTREHEEAVKIALDTANKMQAAGVSVGSKIVCTGICEIRNKAGVTEAIEVILYPTYGGLQTEKFLWALGDPYAAMDSEMVDLDQYGMSLMQECIAATVADGKLVNFNWTDAMEVKQVENTNAGILSFDEITAIFMDNVKRNVFAENGDTVNLRITDVKLSSMLVQKQNSKDYYMMPVWDFIAKDERSPWFEDDDRSVLTLNALDGSIIRRETSFLW